MPKKEDLRTRLGRVIEHMTQGTVVDLIMHKPDTPAVKDYRWCREELVAIWRELR